MAKTKITALTELTDTNIAIGDLIPIVDVSDTSQAASGTTKKATITSLATAVASAFSGDSPTFVNLTTTGTTTLGDASDATTVNGTLGVTGLLTVDANIKFPATQVASADANTLDDYEEGTWTIGVSFGGASVGVTYGNSTGTYIKIGSKVTLNGYLRLTSKGSSTGTALLTGIPFTIPNSSNNLCTASFWLNSTSFANQHQAVGKINTTNIEFWEITEAGTASLLDDTNFANNSEVIVSFNYFV